MTIGSLYNIKLCDRCTTDGNDVWIVDAIRPFPSVTLRQVDADEASPEPKVDASLDAAGFSRFHPLEG